MQPDPLAGIVFDITGNVLPRLLQGRDGYRTLAAYISETVVGARIGALIAEPWRLLGIGDHPSSIDRLTSTLVNLCAVVGELAYDDADPRRIRRSALSAVTPRSNASACPLQLAADACRAANGRRRQRRRAEVRSICRSTGLMARVFDSAYGPDIATEYRVSVELESLFGWHDAVARLEAALRPTTQPSESFLFVPLRNGRPVPRCAMRLIENLWPAPNPDGLNKLPPAHAGNLADILDRAQIALEVLSGICDLPADQRSHTKVETVAGTLVSDLEAATTELRDLPDDPVTAGLLAAVAQLVVRVQAEVAGASPRPRFAAELSRAVVTSEQTDDSANTSVLRLLALEWDIGPSGAAAQFLDVGH